MLHINKRQQILLMEEWPKHAYNKCKMADGGWPPFGNKNQNNIAIDYLINGLTDWHDVRSLSEPNRQLKFRTCKKQNGRRPPS